jgi:hypothetical protein
VKINKPTPNEVGLMAFKLRGSSAIKIAFIRSPFYFFVDLLGFNSGVFPGVVLLSRRR